MTKNEYDKKHQKVIELANAYRDEYLKCPSVERWIESADGTSRSRFYGMVHSMYTAAAELWWIKQNDLIWIPDPDPQKDIHMQKGNVIRMLKYFAQHYHEIEMESIGTRGLIEQCAVVNSAINEDDPNDRIWTEYRRLIAPKERHDPDPEYLRPFVLQKYHLKFDGLSARILQILNDGVDSITMARIAYAMYEKQMNRTMAWRQWYNHFCDAFAIDKNERYRENPQDLIKPEKAYQKILDQIYSYLPDRAAGADIMQKAKRVKAKPVDEYIDQDQYENDLYNGKIYITN